MAAVCSMCTGTSYHTDPNQHLLEKRTQIRGKVYAGSEMAQPRELGEKIRMDGRTIQEKIKKHHRQELRQENTAMYWTRVELELKCSRRFFQFIEFLHSFSAQDRESSEEQTTTARTSPSFLGHPQHSHPARCHHSHTLRHLPTLSSRSLKVAQLSVTSVTGTLTCKSSQQMLHPPEPGRLGDGKEPPLMPLPAVQGSGQEWQHHILLQNRLSPAFHLHLGTK